MVCRLNTAPNTLYSFPYIPIMFPIYLLYIRITLILQNLGIGHNELFCSSDESCCIYHILVFFWFLLQRYNMIAKSMFVSRISLAKITIFALSVAKIRRKVALRGAKERRRKVLSASDAGNQVNFFDQSDFFDAG